MWSFNRWLAEWIVGSVNAHWLGCLLYVCLECWVLIYFLDKCMRVIWPRKSREESQGPVNLPCPVCLLGLLWPPLPGLAGTHDGFNGVTTGAKTTATMNLQGQIGLSVKLTDFATDIWHSLGRSETSDSHFVSACVRPLDYEIDIRCCFRVKLFFSPRICQYF